MEVDKALAKAMWELRSREERGDHQTEEEFLAERVKEVILVDRGRRTFDMTKIKVTDLPTNGEVIIPEDRPPREEMQLQSFKSEVLHICRRFRSEHCDRNGNLKDRNLSREVELGLGELKDRKKQGDIVFTQQVWEALL